MTSTSDITSLKALRAAEASCRRCPLYKGATQVVPGEGPARARIMLVGEQPGDQEDLAGKPFVGPAGRILDQALAEAGIEREAVFVTNAVKHFKFEQRGKRRMHKRPDVHEIERCHWWLDLERRIVKPSLVVALGATAVRSVLGRPFAINMIRGRALPIPEGGKMLATIHPSYILRIDDDGEKWRQYRQFVEDLKAGRRTVAETAA
ncbi:UdgX family uracil-DNA binding protein [Hypericibacter terrae]|jgi:DNA polymerase|uniref:UdgX family uracil-DNA binding protein n=1 Tax=Hypericibacter terrae TaxID=2602015 RepID=UPI0012459073|nr:UdgX family uracil-DNA binding protein [Hypericibacter terrae]